MPHELAQANSTSSSKAPEDDAPGPSTDDAAVQRPQKKRRLVTAGEAFKIYGPDVVNRRIAEHKAAGYSSPDVDWALAYAAADAADEASVVGATNGANGLDHGGAGSSRDADEDAADDFEGVGNASADAAANGPGQPDTGNAHFPSPQPWFAHGWAGGSLDPAYGHNDSGSQRSPLVEVATRNAAYRRHANLLRAALDAFLLRTLAEGQERRICTPPASATCSRCPTPGLIPDTESEPELDWPTTVAETTEPAG
ncbi:hypothetical protein SPI_01679 [Niveomyces insectorum RCEF 264]|uniref:Uncharacterized protein n=1 Tax=Niveomyces insectorum RCEF 264 TaxID=1081102 RepID=A0A167Z538_9HYPO|nr:hypothetical protein SPI_01679 [Niveomyces insectorum RCEF 264]